MIYQIINKSRELPVFLSGDIYLAKRSLTVYKNAPLRLTIDPDISAIILKSLYKPFLKLSNGIFGWNNGNIFYYTIKHNKILFLITLTVLKKIQNHLDINSKFFKSKDSSKGLY